MTEKRQAVGASETEAFLEQIEGQYLAAELLKELTGRERYIIENIFGLASGEQPGRSANELAEVLHLSKGRVAQIKKAALAKMLTRAQEMNITPTG
jgi:Sigma-70, region 4.